VNTNEIIKTGIIGGVIIIVIELFLGFVAPTIVYGFSFIALLLGGFIAGWMIKAGRDDAIVAGGLAGLVYAVIGLLLLYPAISSRYAVGSGAHAVVAIVVSLVLGAIGGFAGHYMVSHQGGSSSSKKRR
jgi:hypothetical protein